MVDSAMAVAAATDKHPIEVHVYDASQGRCESLSLTVSCRPRCFAIHVVNLKVSNMIMMF